MAELHIIKELEGNSGCSLELFQSNGLFIVRKISGSPGYNIRLKKQCIKQHRFLSETIFAPNVINKGYENGCFYFDMEFIQGKTLAEYASSIPIVEVADLTRLFFNNICIQYNLADPKVNFIFKRKIFGLKSQIKQTKNTTKAIEILENFNWTYVYKSPCHGDLTLENIIITPEKEIYLIDFIDSFYNSWLIDIAKLFQDLLLGWSFRYKPTDTTRNLRLFVAKEAILEEIGKMENSEKIIETIYHLLLLNVLRIYPYIKDEKTFIFLENSIQKILNILESSKKGVMV